jgi:hypothetical protein
VVKSVDGSGTVPASRTIVANVEFDMAPVTRDTLMRERNRSQEIAEERYALTSNASRMGAPTSLHRMSALEAKWIYPNVQCLPKSGQ